MADQYELRAMRAAGKTFREIAAVTGLSLSQIDYRLNGGCKRARGYQKSRKERKCMTCGTAFMSEGPHNRMCNACRRGCSASPCDIPAVICYR